MPQSDLADAVRPLRLRLAVIALALATAATGLVGTPHLSADESDDVEDGRLGERLVDAAPGFPAPDLREGDGLVPSERYAGDDRIATAARVAAEAGRAETVLLARADAFPDALAGAALAGALDAPILLTRRDTVPDEVLDLLGDPTTLLPQAGTLDARRVVLLGGIAAIRPAVAEALEEAGFDVERVGGVDRFGTAAAIAAEAGDPGSVDGQTTALLARGDDFADALVAGTLAADVGLPLLLTRTNGLPATTADALDDLGIEQVIVVGGSAAVSDDVAADLEARDLAVRRVAGPSRDVTATEVAAFARDTLGWEPEGAPWLARGDAFPDALAVAPLAGRDRTPILLAPRPGVASAATTSHLEDLAGCDTPALRVAGGVAAVSDEVADAARAALTDPATACRVEVSPERATPLVGEEVELTVTALTNGGAPVADDVQVTLTLEPDPLAVTTAAPLARSATSATTQDGVATFSVTSAAPGHVLVSACLEGAAVCGRAAPQFSAEFEAAMDGEQSRDADGDDEAGDPDGEGRAYLSFPAPARVCYGIVVEGIDLPATAAHLHVGADDENGAVLAHLDAPDADGMTAGCMTIASTVSAAVSDDPAGHHVDVHNAEHPEGEAPAVRGQLARRGEDFTSYSPGSPAPVIPGPATMSGVDFLGNLADTSSTNALNVLTYDDGREVLVAVGAYGLKLYDLADPEAPELVGEVEMPGFHQGEDTNVDPERKLVYMSRDPRASGGNTDTGIAGIYVVDVADPSEPEILTFHELPAGHTATCVEGCRYLWSGGPAASEMHPEDWGGRPIWVTDMRDPASPYTFPEPIDTGRNDGTTDYSHDVQVDAEGVAWVSGRGGVFGYRTSGRHYDPLAGLVREATPTDPVAYGGGGIDDDVAPSRLMHNSVRPVGAAARHGAPADSGYEPGELVYVTEEDFALNCVDDGVFAIASLAGSFDGDGFTSTPEEPFRLETVGVWSPALEEGQGVVPICSAHYFQLRDGIAAYSWYGQGTRFIDVTDPTDPIQIAYFRPADSVSFAPVWHRDVVYVADSIRGIDVIRLTADAEANRASRTQVLAPVLEATGAGVPSVSGFAPDPVYGWSCRLPTG